MRSATAAIVCTIIVCGTGLAEPDNENGGTVPESTVGADVVGARLPLEELRWLNTDENAPIDPKGHITLVRWWTETCPFCARSLPAITELEDEYGERGFQTVAVYHPKPPRDVKNQTVLDAAERIGYEGTVAADDDWAVLRRVYLDTGRRPATSVSFLLDADGVIRYIHPGPELRPGDDPKLQAQYDEMRQAIEALLAETEEI